jgi:RNA polymerase sigma factor (sigma-70 family)
VTPHFESEPADPKLVKALSELSERQRVTVFLVHGEGWTLSEVARLLRITRSSVQRHLERGLSKLRSALNVEQRG